MIHGIFNKKGYGKEYFMNNKIKEILDKLQKVANRETASRNALMEMKDEDYQLLLDYITNLQEENDDLKNRLENTVAECNLRLQENEELKKNQRYYKNGVFSLEYDKETLSDMIDDYKSRIDKAIECIEDIWKECESTNIYNITLIGILRTQLLNILKGEDNE